MLPNQKFRKVHHTTGGAWGGTKVNDEFYQFLVKLFGYDVITTWKEKHPYDYIDLLRDFEIRKVLFKPGTGYKSRFRIPLSLVGMIEEQRQETLMEVLQQTRYAKTVRFSRDKLQINEEIFEEYFSPSLKEIIQQITDIMNCFEQEFVGKIFLASEFFAYPVVRETLKKAFRDKEFIVPYDLPELAVMKGAVIFGHTQIALPDNVQSTPSAVSSGIGM
jgi:hypothetical protein